MSGLGLILISFKNIQENIGRMPGCNFVHGKINFVFNDWKFKLNFFANPSTWLIMPCDPSVRIKIFFFEKSN